MYYCLIFNKKMALSLTLYLFSLTPLTLVTASIPTELEQQHDDTYIDNEIDEDEDTVPLEEIADVASDDDDS